MMNATAVRKPVSTMVAMKSTDEEKRMAHSSKTADNYYASLTDPEMRVTAVKSMKRALSARKQLPSDDTEEITMKRSNYSNNKEKLIKKYFTRKATFEECREFLLQNPEIRRTAKNIQDKVKTLFKE